MAGAPPEVEENSEPLKYTTWVLRVSIHCEGCKRKVKKILHSVEGVYTIDVDSKQHKVTVTGNVDSNTLIRKLEKSGKHAELWCKPRQDNGPAGQEGDQGVQEQGTQNTTVEEAHKNGEPQTAPDNSTSDNPNGNMGDGNSNGQPLKEVRFQGNNPATGDNNHPPGNNPSGGAKKKKKKKKSNNNANNPNPNSNPNSNPNPNNSTNGENGGGEQQPIGAPQNTESPPPTQGPPPGPYPNQGYMSPPRHPPPNRLYDYPPAPTYYAPPPVYAVSYNTTYPSYTASYYSAPTPYSYAYVHQGADVEPHAPSDWSYGPSVQPSNTFEMFSDENPNACTVM